MKSSLPEHVVDPQYLSESSFIFGLGVSTRTWHHFMGWAEAGEAVKYLPDRHDIGTAIPDYRGGLNYTKGFGHLLGSQTPGFFYENVDEAIYVSRFQKDWLFYSQHRTGHTFQFGRESVQFLFNMNYVRDAEPVLGGHRGIWPWIQNTPALDAAECLLLDRFSAWRLYK